MTVAGSCDEDDHARNDEDDHDRDDNSDYGWDLSLEEHIHQLISSETAAPAPAAHTQDEAGSSSRGVSGAAVLEDRVDAGSAADPPGGSDVVYPDRKFAFARAVYYSALSVISVPNTRRRAVAHALADLAPSGTDAGTDQPSPLARFRTAPRKPLSVSDLTAGAWCELQYEYTLTRLPGGRRTRTAAMRAGTKVHARLEEEVHTTVRVEVTSREDVQGLKLWNMIQGVRTLRETGLTRELDVWGVVDGQVVSGIIDAISYRCPDPSLEGDEGAGGKRIRKGEQQEEEEQHASTPKITDYFSSPPRPSRTSNGPRQQPPAAPHRKAYITDIKTRGSSTLPTGAAVRPTKIQLFLYHRFLGDMAAGRLDYAYVFQRYAHDPDAPFSDAFIAQMGGLHDEIFGDAGAAEPDQIRYRTLRSLARLLQDELKLTFPHGAGSLGRLVAAEYRLRPVAGQVGNGDGDGDSNGDGSYGEAGGRCIGTNVMVVDDAVLDRYLDRYLQWWRGLRPASGVDIEEAAFKCGHCEFAADCGWRSALDEERVRRVREKLGSQR